MMKAWCPSHVEKWLDAGMEIEDFNLFIKKMNHKYFYNIISLGIILQIQEKFYTFFILFFSKNNIMTYSLDIINLRKILHIQE